MDADAFLPSEIARLVLGYLRETGCRNTYQMFLKECIHLEEYNKLLSRGSVYPTSIGGKSLVDMLQEYGQKVSEHQKAKQTQKYLWKKLDGVVHQLKRYENQEANTPSFLTGKSGKFPRSSLRTSSTPIYHHDASDSDLDMGLQGVSDNEGCSSPSRCSIVSESVRLRKPTVQVTRTKHYSYMAGCSDSGISGSHRSANSLHCSSPSLASAETSPGLEPASTSDTKVVLPQQLTLVTEVTQGAGCSHDNLAAVGGKTKRGRPPKASFYPAGSRVTHITSPMRINLPGIVDKNSVTMLKFPSGSKLVPAPKLIQTISENRTVLDLTNVLQTCNNEATVKAPSVAKGSVESAPLEVTSHNTNSALASTKSTDNKRKECERRTEEDVRRYTSEMDNFASHLPDIDTIDDSGKTATTSSTPFSAPSPVGMSTTVASSEKQSFLLSGTVDDTSSPSEGPSMDRTRELSPPPSSDRFSDDQLSTPVKNFLSQEVKDAAKNLSPRRKSQAPRRRSTGGVGRPMSGHTRVRTSPATSTVSDQVNASNSNDSFMSQGSQGFVPLIEELINNRDFATKLANNINMVTLKTEGGDTTVVTANEDSPEHSQMAVTSEGGSTTDQTADSPSRTQKDSVDRITPEELEHLFLEEDTLNNIIDMTRNDPHFDTLFQMFHVDKNSFIEKEYGVSASDAPVTSAPLSFDSILQNSIGFQAAENLPTPVVSPVEAASCGGLSLPTSESIIDTQKSILPSSSTCDPSSSVFMTTSSVSQSSLTLPSTSFPASSVLTTSSADGHTLSNTSFTTNCSQDQSVVEVTAPSANPDGKFVQLMYPSEDGQPGRIETVEVVCTPKPVQPKFSRSSHSHTDQATDVTFSTKAMEQLDDILNRNMRTTPTKILSDVGTESLDGSDSIISTKSTPTRIQPSRRARLTSTQSTPGKPAYRKSKTGSETPKPSKKKSMSRSQQDDVDCTVSSPAPSDTTVDLTIMEEDEEEEERKVTKKTKKVGLERIGKTRKTRTPWVIPMSDKRKYLGVAWKGEAGSSSSSTAAAPNADESASLLGHTSCDVELPGPISETVPALDKQTLNTGKISSTARQSTPQVASSAKQKKKVKESGESTKKSSLVGKTATQRPKKTEVVPEFASTLDVSCLPLCSVPTPSEQVKSEGSVDNQQRQKKPTQSSQLEGKKLNSLKSEVPGKPTISNHVRSLNFSGKTRDRGSKKQTKSSVEETTVRTTSESVHEVKQGLTDVILSMPQTLDTVGTESVAGECLPPVSATESQHIENPVCASSMPDDETSTTQAILTANHDEKETHDNTFSLPPTDATVSDSPTEKTVSAESIASKLADEEVAETLITLSTKPVVTPVKTPQAGEDSDTRDTIGFTDAKTQHVANLKPPPFTDVKTHKITKQPCDAQGQKESSRGKECQVTVVSKSSDLKPTLRRSSSMSVMATTSAIIGSPPGVSGLVRVASKPAAMAARAADPGSSNSAEPYDDSLSGHSSHGSSNHSQSVGNEGNKAPRKVSFDGVIDDTTLTKEPSKPESVVSFSPKRTAPLQKLVEHGTKSLKSARKIVKLTAIKDSTKKSDKQSNNERQTLIATGTLTERSELESKSEGQTPGSVALKLTPVKRGSAVTLAVTVPTSPSSTERLRPSPHDVEITQSPFKQPHNPPPPSAKPSSTRTAKQLVMTDTTSNTQKSATTTATAMIKHQSVPGKGLNKDSNNATPSTKSAKRKRPNTSDSTSNSSSDGQGSSKKLKKSKQKDLQAIGPAVNLDNNLIDKILSKIHKA